MAQNFWYPPGSSQAGIITVNQGTTPWIVSDPAAEASLASIDSKVSTAAKQDTGNTSLASIDSKLTNPLPVSGPLTDAQLRATPVPVSISSGITNPLPVQDSAAEASLASIDGKVATETTLAAFSAKTAGALVPSAYDYISLGYTGTNLTTAVFKSGGSGGSTVATLTLAYTGSQLDSVTKT